MSTRVGQKNVDTSWPKNVDTSWPKKFKIFDHPQLFAEICISARNVVDKPGPLGPLTLASCERDGLLGLTSKAKTALPVTQVTFTDLVIIPYPQIVTD